MADAAAKAQKEKAKARAEKAASLEYKTEKPITKNGWFAFALCPICVVAAIVVLWAIAAF